jgi:hypothetical protein
MNENNAEIEISIDRYMSVKLSIPKQMNIAEFQSVLNRTKGLAKLSSLPEELQGKKPRKNGKDFTKDRNRCIEVCAEWKKANPVQRQKMAERYNSTRDRLFQNLDYARRVKWKIKKEEIAKAMKNVR